MVFFTDESLEMYHLEIHNEILDDLNRSNIFLLNRRQFIERVEEDELSHFIRKCDEICNYSFTQTMTKNALLKGLEEDEDGYDILLLVKFDNSDKLSQIIGFIVSKLGEFHLLPETVAIHFICMNEKYTGKTRSSILIGAYLYAIHGSIQYDRIGAIGLLNGYENIVGLCALNKFGFVENKDLETLDTSIISLPMTVDVDISYRHIQQIIDIVINNKSIGSSKLCIDKEINSTAVLKARNELFKHNHKGNMYNNLNLVPVTSQGNPGNLTAEELVLQNRLRNKHTIKLRKETLENTSRDKGHGRRLLFLHRFILVYVMKMMNH